MVLAHNDPFSKSTEPGRADEILTQTLRSALTLVDALLIDHFIVAGDQVLSASERGLL